MAATLIDEDIGHKALAVVPDEVAIVNIKSSAPALLLNLIGVAHIFDEAVVTGWRVAEKGTRAAIDETHEYSAHGSVEPLLTLA